MISKRVEKLAFHLWSEGSGPYYLLIIMFLTIFVIPPLIIAIVARNLAIVEGLTGQLYLVILISSLVAERSAKAAERAGDENSRIERHADQHKD